MRVYRETEGTKDRETNSCTTWEVPARASTAGLSNKRLRQTAVQQVSVSCECLPSECISKVFYKSLSHMRILTRRFAFLSVSGTCDSQLSVSYLSLTKGFFWWYLKIRVIDDNGSYRMGRRRLHRYRTITTWSIMPFCWMVNARPS